MLSPPQKLDFLHQGEEKLHNQSRQIIAEDHRMQLHFSIAETAMDVFDMFRRIPTDDEDHKVIQVLSMRMFNAFASSLKLMLSGYYQVSGLVMRDVLETIFLADYFSIDQKYVSQWRTASSQERKRLFKPVKIREELDKRDNFMGAKRAKMYDLFSELAAHPTMEGIAMLRPKDMDLHMGPFLDPTALKASLDEIGRLAVQAGGIIIRFIPPEERTTIPECVSFARLQLAWRREFYGANAGNQSNENSGLPDDKASA